jgi:hypothetical protein
MSDARKPYSSDIFDDERALVAPCLTGLPGGAGRLYYPLRKAFNDLRYMVKTGAVELDVERSAPMKNRLSAALASRWFVWPRSAAHPDLALNAGYARRGPAKTAPSSRSGPNCRPRRHSQIARSAQGRVRHTASQAAQDRRPRNRNGQPRPLGLRPHLSRGRPFARLPGALMPSGPSTVGPAPLLAQVPSLPLVKRRS